MSFFDWAYLLECVVVFGAGAYALWDRFGRR